ncbi:MAG: four helix bundle protein [Phycisphaerales bacterium]|nr:four helix bundle protein [Phycisphaerales bacterium]
MATIRTFKDLLVWQKGMKLAKSIYRITAKMPESERFGLTGQMRRAAISLPSNIAEGYGRQTTADYLRFLRIARGSLGELTTQYELAYEMEMISPDAEVVSIQMELDRMLQSLIMKIEAKRKQA